MIHFVTFKWRSPTYKVQFTAQHVNILEGMVRRHYAGEMRFVCVTDDPVGVTGETFPLWDDGNGLHNACGEHLPSCYRRLKLFDPETQAAMGIAPGDRIVMLDLDIVVLADLAPLFDRDDDFVGWAVRGTYKLRVFNGSMWLLRAGACADVWSDFDSQTSPAEAHQARYLGSDQAWMSYKIGSDWRPGWTEADGVYSYPKQVQRQSGPPDNARVVIFHGFCKPWSADTPDWVRMHWLGRATGRCLVLGYGRTLWSDVDAALEAGPVDGVIASPEAAQHWPGPIVMTVWSDDEGVSMAKRIGYESVTVCGGARYDCADFLAAHDLDPTVLNAFLVALGGGTVVDFAERWHYHKRVVVTVDHDGKRDGYSIEDVRRLARRQMAVSGAYQRRDMRAAKSADRFQQCTDSD